MTQEALQLSLAEQQQAELQTNYVLRAMQERNLTLEEAVNEYLQQVLHISSAEDTKLFLEQIDERDRAATRELYEGLGMLRGAIRQVS